MHASMSICLDIYISITAGHPGLLGLGLGLGANPISCNGCFTPSRGHVREVRTLFEYIYIYTCMYLCLYA